MTMILIELYYSLYTASQNIFSRIAGESIWENLYLGKITRYTAATVVWECVPKFTIVRTCTMHVMYVQLLKQPRQSVNGPVVGDRPWLWGTNCADANFISAADGPPRPNVAAMHDPGDHPWLPHLVREDRLWGDHWQCDSPLDTFSSNSRLILIYSECIHNNL